MTADPEPNVTQLLVAWSGGDSHALDHLMPAVYGELKRIAGLRDSARAERLRAAQR